MTSAPAPRLSLRGITKRYADVVANDGIELRVGAGQIHALLGENGAGKSTVLNIVAGVIQPDAGRIEWEGVPVVLRSPARARRLGIGTVFQHFSLFDSLTVAENIALTAEQRVPVRELVARIRALSQRYGLPVDAHRPVHDLAAGERQRVEILRCLLQQPRLLVMDEPTSVLSPPAVPELFATLRRLAADGIAILYVSHKLQEIRELCDLATILRNGRVCATAVPRAETAQSLARAMLGGDVAAVRRAPHDPGPVRLQVTGLSDPQGTALHSISLQVRGGEILGIAGVAGNGQRELLAALSGERLADAEAVRIDGRAAGRLDPAQRRALGLRFVPEERVGRGAVPALDLAENCVLTNAALTRHGLVRMAAARRVARGILERFAVRAPDERALAGSLSGGNLQKFIVGREVGSAPCILLAERPTWGVDVGAAALIHRALIDLRDAGVAVLVVSEELDELFALCDRLAVMARGRLSPARPTSQWTAASLGEWMTGSADALMA